MRHLPVYREPAPDDPDASPLALFAVARPEDAPPIAPRTPRDLADALVTRALEAVLAGLRGEGPAVVAVDGKTGDGVDDALGRGDAWVDVVGRRTYRARETGLCGVWRVQTLSEDGAIVGDHVEVADVPRVVRAAAENATSRAVPIPDEDPALMNARPLLVELRHRAETQAATDANHVISLSLLPLSAGDVGALQTALGVGPVRGGSRGYGTCNVALTKRARIWNVQYLNAAGVVVLDTLEVGDVPVALRAMPEDLEDSAVRLEELLARGVA